MPKTGLPASDIALPSLPFRSGGRCAFEGRFPPNGPRLAERARDRALAAGVAYTSEKEDPAANGQRGISKTRSYPLRITPCRGATPPDRAAASFSTLLVPARGAGLPIGGGRGRACAHHFADLTDREAATA